MFKKVGGQTMCLSGIAIFLVLLASCAGGHNHKHQDQVLPPPQNANSEAATAMMEGNRLFEDHQWTAALPKYEKAIRIQPKLAEAHYNLALTLYRKGSMLSARPHFVEAANLAPGHPVIWNAPPFRKYGTVESAATELPSTGQGGHQH